MQTYSMEEAMCLPNVETFVTLETSDHTAAPATVSESNIQPSLQSSLQASQSTDQPLQATPLPGQSHDHLQTRDNEQSFNFSSLLSFISQTTPAALASGSPGKGLSIEAATVLHAFAKNQLNCNRTRDAN